MRVLVACEFSGVVRRAFQVRGHEAWSCDLLPPEDGLNKWHLEGDVRDWLSRDDRWDLMIAHPPCTYLTRAGARWMKGRLPQMEQAIAFVKELLFAPIPRICVENPPGVLSRAVRKPDQSIQPWQFGHGETKETHFWLVGLPPLRPTNIVEGRVPRVHYAAPGPNRWKERSRTLSGIAEAMADQWGGLDEQRAAV